MGLPFPGMNPYLESDLWGDFHLELAGTAKHQLCRCSCRVVEEIYEKARYDSMINYQKPPRIDLDEKELAWLDRRLRTAGLRK